QRLQEELNQHQNQQQQQQQTDSDNDASDPMEGSSSSLRTRKIGKKKGEKLKRKEAKRQYREANQQIKERKAQEKVYDEIFRQKQLEESIKRADELEKMRKEKAKKAKQEEKENTKKQKAEEKDKKQKEARYNKYHTKVKAWVKEKKECLFSHLAKQMGLSEEDIEYILERLCETDPEFELCIWSEDHFLFVTQEDYERFGQRLKEEGKVSIHKGGLYC
ncbi:hypothetical protein BY458DRAFT_435030, partial [Sporodiniella umbellata]